MKKLSIIITVYNTPIKYLNECLDSCPISDEIEIIMIDDGSSLDYTELLKKYHMRYVKTINHGVSSARNVGLMLSEGEYITFVDSDDTFIMNNKIIDSLNGKDIVIARNFLIKEKIIENYYKYNDSRIIDSIELKRNMFLLDNRTIECVETVWSKYYHRDFLLNNHIIFNENLKRGEDVLFNYEAYSVSNKTFYCNYFSYNYRMNNNDSITRSFDTILDQETFKLLDEFEKLFKKLDIKDANYPNYVFRLMIRLIRKYYVYLSKQEFDSKIDLLFTNLLVDYYLNIVDVTNLDIYKKQLHRLLIMKDKIKLYDYLRDVCDKKLLKK